MCNQTKYERIWSFKTKRFLVALDATFDYDLDLSWDEEGKVLKQLESGELTCYLFRVRVYLDGDVIGEDYLGGSIYADPKKFRDHVGAQGKWGSYFTDMVGQAITETRKKLATAPRLRKAA